LEKKRKTKSQERATFLKSFQRGGRERKAANIALITNINPPTTDRKRGGNPPTTTEEGGCRREGCPGGGESGSRGRINMGMRVRLGTINLGPRGNCLWKGEKDGRGG